ncbi:MAG TPA: adenylate/guanylate cyclase domain-containing protein [Minicystis sp.]|nr:adenylate/guanylate cyclase domain-containing protein [Minicystis sp.]
MNSRRHRWTLRFEDRALEAEFQARRTRRLASRRSALGCLFAAVTWAMVALYDRIALPALAPRLWLIHLGVAVPVLLALAALFAFAGGDTRRRAVSWAIPTWTLVPGLCFAASQAVVAPTPVPGVGILVACYLLCIAFPTWSGLTHVGWCLMAPPIAAAYFAVVALGCPGATLADQALPALLSVALLLIGWTTSRAQEQLARRDLLLQLELADERARSERLLLNVLPRPIAERLKRGEVTIADSFDSASVIFADLVGFTPLSQRLAPAELVALLDDVFTAFDALAERLGLEKIKTVGDCYMAVAGLPAPRADHAAAAAEMALEMRSALERVTHGRGLRLRIGIASGPLVAGVIGRQKYIYDVWGDTVNTASRMESHSVPGEIQVTDAVREALAARYVFEARGAVEIKGKGPMNTFFLRGRA